MATTRIIPMHINKGKSAAQCLKARISYVLNPKKTEDGRFVSSYACAPETADQEFLLGRNAYIANTGRRIGNEVIAYQIRQSFKPGEVTVEEANQIGYELATQILHGDFAFLVATHTDHAHIHNHIVFSAVSLNCTHKFKDVQRSGKTVAALSDKLCREHRLSVIENPKNKTVSYDKWQGERASISGRDTIRMMIDSSLRMHPNGFDALMQMLEEAGCRIKRGVHISVKPPHGERFLRLDSLGAAYTESALQKVLFGNRILIPRIPRKQYTDKQIASLIDIEKKLRKGKGRGYQIWAERHNLDAVSKSVIYLKENNINSYEELMKMISEKTELRNTISGRVKSIQSRMRSISEQKKAITTYRRTRDIYAQDRTSGCSQAFYQEHAKAIEDHMWAEKVYANADGKLPTLAELSTEYDQLLSEKRKDWAALAEAKTDVSNLWRIKTNMDIIVQDDAVEGKREEPPKQIER